MKADPFAQLRLLDLQSLDSGHDRLTHQRKTLPEMVEIDRLDAAVASRRNEVVLAQTAVSDLTREQRKFEGDIEQVRARKDRDVERLNSGAITNAKQLQELEHEVGTLLARQTTLEDAELEVMERAETAQGELDRLLEERSGHETARAAAVVARDAAWTVIDTEIERTAAERIAVAAELPAELLALYEKIRVTEGGIGAGIIERGRCGACRLDLMQNEKAEYRAAPVDELLRHECRRIVVRTAESGL